MSAAAAILVTGATGFVGTAVVRRLVRHGHPVHGLARRTSDKGRLEGLGVRWHEGDLLEPATIERALADFRAAAREEGRSARVVHCAALISYRTGDAELARCVNVEGTRVVLDACQKHGIERVVHVSSVVAVGTSRRGDQELDEDAAFNGAELYCDYVTTKRAAEDFALSVSRQLDVVVVNPGAIFGPAPDGSNTARFLVRIAEGRIGSMAPPGSVAVVGIDDVAEGIRLALERGRRGRRYLLTESNLRHLELLAMAAGELGVRPIRRTVPTPIWRALVVGAGLWDRVRPSGELTPQALRLLGVHFRFDSRRARA
ncbi:MAG: NAD-dependent epimerase/dehydratase family protein [Planctomycetota bacterium]|nr:NAD-dependent epimerase/dehydratase family protein [Planctomycetota bacterium]